jgi:small subunit ribosomal protein S7
MPRRKAAVKREVLPDPLYGSDQVAKFINVVMLSGKKSIAEGIVYDALATLVERLKKEDVEEDSSKGGKGAKASASKGPRHTSHSASRPLSQNPEHEEILASLKRALDNVAPTVEVKSRRVGGATYQVPIEVAAERGHALAMRWIVYAARKRSEKTMALRLAGELIDACANRGTSVKTRDDVHRMAKANQAFAHYRW